MTPRPEGPVQGQHKEPPETWGGSLRLWVLRVVTLPPMGESDMLSYHRLPRWPRAARK